MKPIFFILCFLLYFFSVSLNAQMLISPYEALKNVYGQTIQIEKKNVLLKTEQAKKVSKAAQAKLYSKIIRIFTAKNDNKIVGHGILISSVMRTKTAVVLYMINTDKILQASEVIAFNEPLEYVPSKTWLSQLSNVSISKKLRVSKEIPTITGATLTANGLISGSRVAFAVYKEIIQGK